MLSGACDSAVASRELSTSGSTPIRVFRPVRRCLRGLVDSVKEEESTAGGVSIGVDSREVFEVAREVERRFGAIVLSDERQDL